MCWQSGVTSGDTARESGIMLQATNPAHEPLFFTKDEVHDLPVVVVGRVVELRAKF